MDTLIARNLGELPATAAQWNRLVGQDPEATVFQTHEWFEAWWSTFGRRDQLRLFCLSEGDRLVGLAPLMLGIVAPDDEIRFVGHGHADYLDVISRPEDRERTLSAVLGALNHNRDWSVIKLSNIPGTSRTPATLPSLCRTLGYRILHGDNEICPTLAQEGPEPTPCTLIRKYRVRRASNYFQRRGNLEIRDIVDQDVAMIYLQQFFSQHIRRWQGTSTPSLFVRPTNQLFYERLVESLLPAGHLLFTVAELDGHPIAFHFGFDFAGRAFWYKPSFDPDFAQHSPGTLIIEHLLKHIIRNNLRELDFTIGGEPFKQRYTNEQRTNINLRVFRFPRHYLTAWVYDRSYRCLRWLVRRLGVIHLLRRYFRP